MQAHFETGNGTRAWLSSGHHAGAVVLAASLPISAAIWRLPDTGGGASPIWTVLIWLLLGLAAVLAVVIALAAKRRGAKTLALFGLWGAASALLLIPVAAVILFTVGLLFDGLAG